MDPTINLPGPEPRGVDTGRGVNWWTDAWALFMKNPGMWVVLGLVLLVICVVLGMVPMIGSLATALLLPALVGSWMMAARKQESGGTLEIGDLFLAFKEPLNSLVVLGALNLAATAAIMAVTAILGFGAFMGMGMGAAHHNPLGALAAAGAGLLGVLVALALFVPVTMAFWFAPPLVVFDRMAPIDAVKASFAGCMRNVMPFLIYGVIGLVACALLPLTLFLGLLVFIPVTLLSIYTSYREVFNR